MFTNNSAKQWEIRHYREQRVIGFVWWDMHHLSLTHLKITFSFDSCPKSLAALKIIWAPCGRRNRYFWGYRKIYKENKVRITQQVNMKFTYFMSKLRNTRWVGNISNMEAFLQLCYTDTPSFFFFFWKLQKANREKCLKNCLTWWH